jgi:hypothetical protein
VPSLVWLISRPAAGTLRLAGSLAVLVAERVI